MKNSKTQIVIKAISAIMAAALLTGALTGCANMEEILDQIRNAVTPAPNSDVSTPTADLTLTPEEAERAARARKFINDFSYETRDKGIGAISVTNCYPSPDKGYHTFVAPRRNTKAIDYSYTMMPVNDSVYEKIKTLAQVAQQNSENGIQNIEIDDLFASKNLYTITVTFDEKNPNEEIIDKFLSIIEPFIDEDSAHFADAETISEEQKAELIDYLSTYNEAYKKGIASFCFLKNIRRGKIEYIDLHIFPYKQNPDYPDRLMVDASNASFKVRVTKEQAQAFEKYYIFKEHYINSKFYDYLGNPSSDDDYYRFFSDQLSDKLEEQVLYDLYLLIEELKSDISANTTK